MKRITYLAAAGALVASSGLGAYAASAATADGASAQLRTAARHGADDPAGAADLAWFAGVVGTTADPGRRQTLLVRTPGGRHAIDSWAERVTPALRRLLGTWCAG